MSYGSIVHSRTSVDSTANAVLTGSHTHFISFFNTHASTNAVVRLNGGPREVLIPAGKNYVEIKGDYTSYQVITAGVTLAVFAIG
jgi:hypothetical protein